MPRPGKFLFAVDPGAQNDHRRRSRDGGQDDSPGTAAARRETLPERRYGVRSFPAGAYSPLTNRYYMPIYRPLHGKRWATRPARFLALDLNTQKLAWDIRTRVPQSSALLTTAGGLVFSATPDRYFRAFDDRRRQGAVDRARG